MQTVSSEDKSLEEYAYQISNAPLSPSGQLTRENLLNPGLQLTAFSDGDRWYRRDDDVNLRKIFRDISETYSDSDAREEPSRLKRLLYNMWISLVHLVDESRLNICDSRRFSFKPTEDSPDDFRIDWPSILLGQNMRWKLVACRFKATEIAFVYLDLLSHPTEFRCGELTAGLKHSRIFAFDISYYGPTKSHRWAGLCRSPKKGCSYIYVYENGSSTHIVKIREKDGKNFANVYDYNDPAFISAVDSVCPIE